MILLIEPGEPGTHLKTLSVENDRRLRPRSNLEMQLVGLQLPKSFRLYFIVDT
jgi:hypothetical protein